MQMCYDWAMWAWLLACFWAAEHIWVINFPSSFLAVWKTSVHVCLLFHNACGGILSSSGCFSELTLTLGHRSKVAPDTPPLPRGTRDGWCPPLVFLMLQYFEKISPSVESLWCALQDEVYIMGCRSAGGLWRYSRWPPYWAPSWILPKIKNCQKTLKIGNFWCWACGIWHD